MCVFFGFWLWWSALLISMSRMTVDACSFLCFFFFLWEVFLPWTSFLHQPISVAISLARLFGSNSLLRWWFLHPSSLHLLFCATFWCGKVLFPTRSFALICRRALRYSFHFGFGWFASLFLRGAFSLFPSSRFAVQQSAVYVCANRCRRGRTTGKESKLESGGVRIASIVVTTEHYYLF